MEYISIIFSALGAIGVLVTLITVIAKKGKEQGTLETKLNYLIDSDKHQEENMKLLMRSHENIKDSVREMAGKIVVNERDIKKAHERIDETNKRVNKLNSEIAVYVEIKKKEKKKNGTTN